MGMNETPIFVVIIRSELILLLYMDAEQRLLEPNPTL
jgi:hypothetical protein